MSRTLPFLVICITALPALAWAQQERVPMRVMSDTREYCDELAERVNDMRIHRVRVPADVVALRDEGERLCAMGHVRPGITRLRMAIRRMQERP